MRLVRICTALQVIVLTTIFLVPDASAQPAQSGEETASDTPQGAELEQMEARRRVLFQQMLADPTNLDVAFEYAGLSARVGDVEAAISTLERMLIFAPGLPRLQLELGVLYFRLGAYETARSYFDNALKAPDVPEVVKARVDPYLAAIDNRTKGYTFGGTILAGIRYQTNANAAPGGGTIIIGGIPFELDEEATGQPDFNAFVSGYFNYSLDLQNQGDRFDVNLATYGAWYKERNEIDTGLAELKFGPVFDLERFGMENSVFGTYAILNGIMLGHDPYLAAAGAGATFVTLLSPRSRLLVQEEYRREEYLDSDRRPTASLKSGHRISGNARLQQQVTEWLSVVGGVEGERRLTERDFLDVWEWGGSAGWVLAFYSPNANQTEKSTFGVVGGYRRRDFDEPDPTLNPSEAEWDNEAYVVGTLNVPVGEGWGVQAQSGYRNVDSNYPTRVFDNIHGSLAVSKRF